MTYCSQQSYVSDERKLLFQQPRGAVMVVCYALTVVEITINKTVSNFIASEAVFLWYIAPLLAHKAIPP